jgi:hemolysin activation/secretion protein
VDLEVNVGRDPIDVVANVQNFGSESIGRWGGLVRTDFNGFTPWGERSSLILYSTLESDEQRIIQLIEEARIGDTGLLARGSLAYAKTKPGGELKVLGLESDSVVASIEGVYPLIRTRRRNLNALGGFEYVNQETVFGTGGVLSDDRVRILFGRLEGSARRTGVLPLDASAGVEVRKGVDVLDASQAGDPTLTRNEAQPTATVWRFDARADAALPARLGAGFAVQAQYTDEPLLSYEQLAVGNLTIGRGYDPSSVSGDRGVAASFELRTGPFTPASWLQVSGYGFYDVARIEDLSAGGEERTVASAGAGIRFRVSYGTRQFNVDLAYAEPLDKALSQAPEKPPSRLLLSVTAALY